MVPPPFHHSVLTLNIPELLLFFLTFGFVFSVPPFLLTVPSRECPSETPSFLTHAQLTDLLLASLCNRAQALGGSD